MLNSKMKKIVFYNYGGSANHGCEAIIRTLSNILCKERGLLLSESQEEDKRYKINEIISLKDAKLKPSKVSLSYLKGLFDLKIKKNYFTLDTLPYLKSISTLKNNNFIAASIGGDIYCYDDFNTYILIDKAMRKKASKTLLLGCSIEPTLLNNSNMLENLKGFDLISTRESLTYNALLEKGLDNVCLVPDSAFTLPIIEKKGINKEFLNNSVGINVSPLVQRKGNSKDSVLDNYLDLVEYILNETNLNIALIPHVVWKSNDDRELLTKLKQSFKDNARVILIEDCNCMELKGYISNCRFFVGARTHATIAAYSTCVPTLAVGYSIKARGIAKDLFGTYDNYVISIKDFITKKDLTNAFKWIMNNEESIRNHLNSIMPDYISQVNKLKEYIEKEI